MDENETVAALLPIARRAARVVHPQSIYYDVFFSEASLAILDAVRTFQPGEYTLEQCATSKARYAVRAAWRNPMVSCLPIRAYNRGERLNRIDNERVDPDKLQPFDRMVYDPEIETPWDEYRTLRVMNLSWQQRIALALIIVERLDIKEIGKAIGWPELRTYQEIGKAAKLLGGIGLREMRKRYPSESTLADRRKPSRKTKTGG